MDTMLLAIDTWDLCLDAAGNIALATEPYALAQDVASAIRTFLLGQGDAASIAVSGECWYDDTIGIPYFDQILGKNPPLSVLVGFMEAAALTVPGVKSATVVLQSFNPTTRVAIGQVQFTDTNGVVGTVSI